MKTYLMSLFAFCIVMNLHAQSLFVETESFQHKGGWVIDQQFTDLMGSPYMMAHGMGVPVEDATTAVSFPNSGTYYVYVRTYNWTSPWKKGKGPGQFTLYVGSHKMNAKLGCEGDQWMWQLAGKVRVKAGMTTLRLKDLTGFDGRCDAIYFTTKGTIPPNELKQLDTFRRKELGNSLKPISAGSFDFVVVGGGVAGMSAAVSAARLGCKVALINDRPVWGGNNSSEVRVHMGGRIDMAPYKALGGLQKEFAPTKKGNAQPASNYEDNKKSNWLENEKNVSLFSNYRAFAVEMDGDEIISVTARHIETGKELRFEAPLFADCTGDGSIGYLAGADYRMGREGRDEFGEQTAPEKADKMTMGSSVQWYSVDAKKKSSFPRFKYGIEFNEQNCERVTMGEWTWETGMNLDQIKDFERIRDYGMLVVYSNWSFLKNSYSEKKVYANRRLGWVAYIAGKRESRRLLGDYILKEDDIKKYVAHEDATFTTTWSVDLHFPDPENTKDFKGREFKAKTKHVHIYPYPVPYRCLYSRNVTNLFMAGRDISVTHVALGTVRVMRTTGMMGEVVGMAASLCRRYDINPRHVYWYHLNDLKKLMQKGVGKKGLPNNQRYNQGGLLSKKPEIK